MAELDVLVIGGGPAGLVTSLDAARRGLRVALIDRRKPPIDKACGEGLMPDGVERLRALGVQLGEHRPFHGISYFDGEVKIDGRFPGMKGIGIRRTRLHSALTDAATAAGVELRWGVRAEGLVGIESPCPGVATDHGVMRGHLVVGADGLRSQVRRWTDLESPTARRLSHPEQTSRLLPSSWFGVWRSSGVRKRFGVRRHYGLEPWSHRVEVYWSGDAEAYVTPIADDEIGVAILWSGRKAGFDELLGAFPKLKERLGDAAPISRDRGAGPLRQKVRGLLSGHVALVGDAAGYVDAITGEGLSIAFHQSSALLDSWLANDLAGYPRRARAVARVPEALTHLLLLIEAHPALRRRVFRALVRDPSLFERFLAVHVRHRTAWSLAPAAPRMVWRLVTG